MKNFIFYILFFTLIAAPSLAFGKVDGSSEKTISAGAKNRMEKRIENAGEVFLDYHKNLRNLDKSIRILKTVLRKDPDNLEALLLLSRVRLTYGHAKALKAKRMTRVFKNTAAAAERAIEVAPKNPDAHFYRAAGMASLGKTQGILKSLFLLLEIRKELKLVLELDPKHAEGLAMQGILYYALPGILGGDSKVSETYLKKSISIEPNNTVFKIYLSLNLSKQKKYDEARKVLKEIIQEKNPKVYADWYFNEKLAKSMLAKLDEKEK